MSVSRILSTLHPGDADPDRESFFDFRRVLFVPAWTQVVLVVVCFVTTVFCTHTEYVEKGTVFGYQGPAFTLLFVAIYEEVIFRGWILGRLVRSIGSPRAVLVSSLLFGIWHLRNIYWKDAEALAGQMIHAGLVIGPVLAWMTVRCRSIWPAVILHYANNLFFTYVA